MIVAKFINEFKKRSQAVVLPVNDVVNSEHNLNTNFRVFP